MSALIARILLPASLSALLLSAAAAQIPEQPDAAPNQPETGRLALIAGDDEPGFVVLFDGSSLDAFRGYQKEEVGAGWKIEDGVLAFDGSGGGDLTTVDEFGDFELRFDWKVAEGANSGVMYRVSLGDAAPYLSGPEYQILDDERHADGKAAETSAASLYALYAPQDKVLHPVGEWNEARIVVAGNHVQHWLNGVCVVSAQLHSDDWNQRVAASKFARWQKFGRNPSGHICFQDHGDWVWFRNIRIRRIESVDAGDGAQASPAGQRANQSAESGGGGR